MSAVFTTVYFPPRPIARRRFFFKSLLRTFFGLSTRVLREIFDGSLKEKSSFRSRLFANSGGRFGRIVKRGRSETFGHCERV